MRRAIILLLGIAVLIGAAFIFLRTRPVPIFAEHHAGDRLDSLNNVVVYDNGGFSNTLGRNTVDGYNLGLKYQCVEFVKRYYFEHYHHRMPNSYGNAKDFFDPALTDGTLNTARGLVQFTNSSASKPAIGDLVIFDGWKGNPFGHVAIISTVEDGEVEVIQQNTGSTRNTFDLDMVDGKWRMDGTRILGWLRMPA